VLEFLISHSARLIPQHVTGHLGWLRGAIGAGLAIAFAGATALLLRDGSSAALPYLVPPMGASAVLVFGVPASPLAQPWPVIGGNLISSIIGIAVGVLLGSPILSAAIAVGLAIAVMSLTRCLHPPGGASALLCALGAAGLESWGWGHLLPIALNVFALALAGWLYNNLTGHPWPHHVVVPAVPPSRRTYTHEDLEQVLAEWNELLDVDVDDLDALFQALNRRIDARELRK
jgi:CBS domain-containing membrane protein